MWDAHSHADTSRHYMVGNIFSRREEVKRGRKRVVEKRQLPSSGREREPGLVAPRDEEEGEAGEGGGRRSCCGGAARCSAGRVFFHSEQKFSVKRTKTIIDSETKTRRLWECFHSAPLCDNQRRFSPFVIPGRGDHEVSAGFLFARNNLPPSSSATFKPKHAEACI